MQAKPIWKIYETSFRAITYANSLLIGWHNKFCCAKQTSVAHSMSAHSWFQRNSSQQTQRRCEGRRKCWQNGKKKKKKKTKEGNDAKWQYKLKENKNDNPRSSFTIKQRIQIESFCVACASRMQFVECTRWSSVCLLSFSPALIRHSFAPPQSIPIHLVVECRFEQQTWLQTHCLQ